MLIIMEDGTERIMRNCPAALCMASINGQIETFYSSHFDMSLYFLIRYLIWNGMYCLSFHQVSCVVG